MEPDHIKLTVNGVEYSRIEDVPEPFRALIRSQIEAAKKAGAAAAAQAAAGAQSGSQVRVSKRFNVKVDVKNPAAAPPALGGPPPIAGSGLRTALFLAAVAGLLLLLVLRLRHG